MSIALMPGSRLPAFCTSMGRVMLAALPEAEARALLSAAPLVPRTRYTRTDPSELMAELAQVAEQGYAVIDQEVELGLRSIAVPLHTSRGLTVAALNVGVSSTQASLSDLTTLYLPALRAMQADLRAVIR
jgi:IclR family pca regulon transcriptional regulator